MNALTVTKFVLAVLLSGGTSLAQAPGAPPPPSRWATESAIIRLIYAIDLAEFPFKNGDLARQLPLPPMQGYSGGKSARSLAGTEATIYAITDPSLNAGFYALRVVVERPRAAESNAEVWNNVAVVSAEVLFMAQPSIFFSVSGHSPHKVRLEEMREKMKRERLTPKEYVEKHWQTQPEFYFQSSLSEKERAP